MIIKFLLHASVIILLTKLNTGRLHAQAAEKRVALIANYYAIASHANVLATKFFVGFPTDEGIIPSQIKIVSLWIDQPSPDSSFKKGAADVGRRIAKMHGTTLYPTIAQALTLGSDTLAVDAVIYIGEHGDYSRSRLGVKMYPRLNFLEQIFRVLDASKKIVPVFSDKALAYSWIDARWIYDRSKELGVPLMAGSVLPYSWRDPMIQHPIGTKITEAVAVGYGVLDSYGFHVAEILQCMLERRAGGESGVASVQGLKGSSVWQAADEGRFSVKLVEEACNAIKGKRNGSMRDMVKEPIAILVNYKDGTKGTILLLSGYVGEGWGYAASGESKVLACEFILESTANAHFSYLGLNIQNFFKTGKLPAPLERTLLTSGILDMGIRSIAEGESQIKTPFLDIHYSVEGYAPVLPRHPRPVEQSFASWPPKEYGFIVSKPDPAGVPKQINNSSLKGVRK